MTPSSKTTFSPTWNDHTLNPEIHPFARTDEDSSNPQSSSGHATTSMSNTAALAFNGDPSSERFFGFKTHNDNANTSQSEPTSSYLGEGHFVGFVQQNSQDQGHSQSKGQSVGAYQDSFASLPPSVLELSARLGSKPDKSSRQSMLAKLYQNRSARSRNVPPLYDTRKSPPPSTAKLIGSKRAFSDDDESASSSSQAKRPSISQEETVQTHATAEPHNQRIPNMSGEGLLHNSCKLYPKTLTVVQSALQFDPEAIRRPVSVESNPETSSRSLLKRRRAAEVFCYPINIAIRHDGSNPVLGLLANAGPDVLLMKDGSCQSSSLGTALRLEKDISVIKLLLDANPKQTQVVDLHHALPLHVAARLRTVTLDLVKLIYHAYPGAISETNVRGETPVQVAERNPYCKEEIVNFLQDCAYRPGEENAEHIEDSLLEQPERFAI